MKQFSLRALLVVMTFAFAGPACLVRTSPRHRHHEVRRGHNNGHVKARKHKKHKKQKKRHDRRRH